MYIYPQKQLIVGGLSEFISYDLKLSKTVNYDLICLNPHIYHYYSLNGLFLLHYQ